MTEYARGGIITAPAADLQFERLGVGIDGICIYRVTLTNPGRVMHSDDEVMTFGEFRRIFCLCPKGHYKGYSSAGPDYCLSCEINKRKEECPHDGPRLWFNPSNLPGENRWECGACHKGGLPAQV